VQARTSSYKSKKVTCRVPDVSLMFTNAADSGILSRHVSVTDLVSILYYVMPALNIEDLERELRRVEVSVDGS